jgi:hypothetical protein
MTAERRIHGDSDVSLFPRSVSQFMYLSGEDCMKTPMFAVIVIASIIVMFSGCFPGGSSYSPQEPAGFFSGVWHGWIAPLSLIVGLFKDGIRVYEPFNTGWWYDFGFYIAVISGFGGISLFRSRKKKGEGELH